ncbi:hypothetical protein PILCRDRAFT_728762 [Piloderma croceum F 1598]|uniref:Uncharacterized protein n=1 Tax=Piloderma croceum (strain F 1598) TaxID=765440 RepID=A0A0C3B7X8_PILCF|nr:hypothetical protein PILCRDRAFT_728762 [Piloderma croceum F 1598]
MSENPLPSPFSFWVPHVHRPCPHDFRWGHKARTSLDVIPTINHLYACLTDVFSSINGLDTSYPSPIFPLPPTAFFQFHRPHGGRLPMYIPFLMYMPSSHASMEFL